MPALTSAVGVLAFLDEDVTELQVYALKALNEDIDTFWTEVASSLPKIEALYEDDEFPERQLAALVLSKAYYHLGAYHESMTFALAAGDLFKLDTPGEFEDTIISKCIDQYIAVTSARHTAPKTAKTASLPALSTSFGPGSAEAGAAAGLISPTTPFSHTTLPSKSLLSRASTDNTILDPTYQPVTKEGRSGSIAHLPDQAAEKTLERVVERLFEACLRGGQYKQVVGIAVEAKNLSMVRRVITRASQDEKKAKGKGPQEAGAGPGPAEELTEYALGICMDLVQERSLRTEMLRLILDLLNDIPKPDYFAIAKCAVYLNADEEASALLRTLIDRGDRASLANAYQIAFDIYDNGTQEFLAKVIKSLPSGEDEEEETAQENSGTGDDDGGDDTTSGSGKNDAENNAAASESEPLLGREDGDAAAAAPRVTGPVPHREPATAAAAAVSAELGQIYRNVRSILVGTKTIQLNLEFLYRNNRTDLSVLNKVRDSLEGRNSIFHTAVTFCNGFMNQGTTNDKFFRDNLEWLGRAINWSKFTATAALGVIHRGNIGQSRKLLEPYLPKVTGSGLSTGSPYSQGGALYAYGLIHANHGAEALDFLSAQYAQASDEVILHGGALGLGIAGMASGSDEIFNNLKMTMFTDSALNGEAVGLAMGLIMLGTGSVDALEDMIRYAHETNHEKTVRGLALGMALIMYGRQEGADELVDGLLGDPDPTLRYGGIMTVALAYCGTGSNKAIRKLLHIAVSDVSDDVRRVAVMSLGFILFRKPGSVPRMVELLSESYNPHVRYGSAMALGISCAGTGLDAAVELLEPMTKDPSDFVRQGALISLGMIMIQQNEVMNPKAASIRATLKTVVGDRHEDAMTKFGAAIALGIIDAAGRNCTIGLQTQTGNLSMTGVVGIAVFLQYWYWFPFTHFLALSFSPTSVIGLDADLEMPSLAIHCAARQSLFDYPPEQEVKTEEGPALIATAILSTTAQAKRRAQLKERAMRRESMDLDSVGKTPAPMDVDPAGAGGAKAATPSAGVDDDRMDVDEEKKEDKPASRPEEEDKPAPGPEEEAAANKDVKAGTVADNSDSPPPPDTKRKAAEKVGYEIENLSRVLPGQLKYISIPAGRYKPVKKPTGGPILLLDSQPDEPKTLIEEKLKKMKTEKAPVAGQGLGAAGPSNTLLSALGQQAGAAGGAVTDMRTLGDLTNFLNQVTDNAASSAGRMGAGGAAAAAGVLTAVDEDEDDEEAEMPQPFEYDYPDSEQED